MQKDYSQRIRESGALLLADKPTDWTSFDVVNKVRNTLEKYLEEQTKERKRLKVGHSGTLDPFATGLLIIAIGAETKNIDKYMKQNKTYAATMVLGAESSTGDRDGEITDVKGTIPDIETVEQAFARHKGKLLQTPPAYSAIKVDGVRAYKRARRGEKVELKPREVTVNAIGVESYDYPIVKFVCNVSSGTYIRSLAEDIANDLGAKAYLSQLRRSKIGEYSVDEALLIDKKITADDILRQARFLEVQ